MNNKQVIIFVLILVVIVSVIGVFLSVKKVESQYDTQSLAQCLKDKGVTFYGAWWCPHCQNTKKLFGDAASNLPYIECSGANPDDQLEVCTVKGIKTYPTWFFPDGSSLTGERTLSELADKAQCPLLSAKTQ